MHSAAALSLEPCSQRCPGLVREALSLISPKWAAPILIAIHTSRRPLRYAELARMLGDITPKELARNLRQLETSGMLERTVFPTVPPSVEYELTEPGQSLSNALEPLAHWAADNAPADGEQQ
jgi:DNA-binding HxlR family transcriptional regulator